VDLVEDAFGKVHEWLPDADRGEWLMEHSQMYIVFLDGVYRGFFCVVNHERSAYLHFGTTGEALAYRDVIFGLRKAQRIARNIYGISELFCEIDDGSIIHKMIGKLGFEPVEQSNTYRITYYGQETEKTETN